MQALQNIWSKNPRLAVGLMSGTSLDGVDAALVTIFNHGVQTKVELRHFITFPYPPGLKEKILEISTPGRGSVDQICQLNVLLGEVFATAAKELLRVAGVDPQTVDFIGSHGQTVHHLPQEKELFGYKFRATLQLAEPAVIAKRTGILTVADFRPADLALGGQGAPLVPYFDYLLFRSDEKNRALLNIGGIANLTILKKGCQVEDILAFDTGPGNMVVDALMTKLFGKPYDENGAIAQSGRVSEALLLDALNHPYFSRPFPKSTGREEFGGRFCERFLDEANRLQLKPGDILATAAELTVRAIWANYENFIAPKIVLEELIVSGGGSRNLFMINSLRQKAQTIAVKVIDEFGISAKAKEAVCFAVLANETISGNPNNVPAATGASRPTILGKICS